MQHINPFEGIYERLDGLQQQVLAIHPTPALQIEIINRDVLCQRLGVTEPTCIRWEKKGLIPSIRIGSNVRYNWYAVVEALEKKEVASDELYYLHPSFKAGRSYQKKA